MPRWLPALPRILALGAALMTVGGAVSAFALEIRQRNTVFELGGKYVAEFYLRHPNSEAYSGAFHFHHGRLHDVLSLTPMRNAREADRKFAENVLDFLYQKRARIGPLMEYYGPYTSQFAWRMYRAIDWTHMHHEQTYSILSDRDIPWELKKAFTDRAVRYYIEKNAAVARSIAPLDITMRRAGVMMKPYFTLFRNNYPRANDLAWVAHWWHPVIYEAMMISGNDAEQDLVVSQTNRTMFRQVLHDRPQRMLLSRESMPRYSRMSPQSANIFDNLHMLHGISFDILAYEGWTLEQKQAEINRFIDAMSYHPGDEHYVRKFRTPWPDMDPRVYYGWMRRFDGEMNRIMREMFREMMPLMMPGGMPPEKRERVMAQFRKKMMSGMQEGEIPGSLHDALKALMPEMQTSPAAMAPGETPQLMVAAMLNGWRRKYGDMAPIPPWPMEEEPEAPPLPVRAAAAR